MLRRHCRIEVWIGRVGDGEKYDIMMSNDATDSLRSQFVTLKNGQGQHSKYIWVNIEKGQSY